jgi:hypothetical protein
VLEKSAAISERSFGLRGNERTARRSISRRMRVRCLNAGWLASLPEVLLGNAPHYVSILVYNQSGQALSPTAGNHTAQYASESYA